MNDGQFFNKARKKMKKYGSLLPYTCRRSMADAAAALRKADLDMEFNAGKNRVLGFRA